MLERAIYIPRENFDQSRRDFAEKVLTGEVVYLEQTRLRKVIKHEGNDPVGLLDDRRGEALQG